ncbi:hypothetical protein GGX14DRAFT_612019 [Mycena pura]|uniref:Uncharacterized protein n=1 Tax=Mycena pura TaxID=153505 RepID=A0AAD6YSE4_9AGAR|nr:hypothetical protein GGX14DRAFT_612019 [Mycena pura]
MPSQNPSHFPPCRWLREAEKAPVNVESIMNDVDAASKLSRKTMEGLISSVLEPIQRALLFRPLTRPNRCKLVGGSTHVPAGRMHPASVPRQSPLNQDEAITRGATFCCGVSRLPWRQAAVHLILPPRHISHSTAATHLTSRPSMPNGNSTCVVVKTKDNQHSVMSFESAYVEEEVAPTDVDPAARRRPHSRASQKEARQEGGIARAENAMHAADKLVMDTEDRENTPKEYVCDMRDNLKVYDCYVSFVQAEEKLVSRLDALKVLGDLIIFRYCEFESRDLATARDAQLMTQATSGDDK